VVVKELQNTKLALYRKQYVDIEFERAGLFAALRKKYRCSEVLYPGCSVHITPSLYFPHVVYIDQSPESADFFSDVGAIDAYLQRNKHYRRRAHFQFIAQDFKLPIDLAAFGFDLLLSLYTDGVAKACRRYLKHQGIFVTNNFQNDIEDVFHDPAFELKALLRLNDGRAKFLDKRQADTIRKTRKKKKDHLQSTGSGFAYRESVDDYFIFERRKRGKSNRMER
jgi:hypothetical protein